MPISPLPNGPRFEVGDEVTMIAPGTQAGKAGVVVEILEPKTGDYVYRYRVRFMDGDSGNFFGFELTSGRKDDRLTESRS
jgi:hypothetical protein